MDEIGRNEPCPCDSGLKFKKCHGRQADDSTESPGFIRVTFHLRSDEPHNVLLLMKATREVVPVNKVDGNLLEAFLTTDEDAFGSGIPAHELLTAQGRSKFLDHLGDLVEQPDLRISVASRNKEMAFALPPAAVVDVSVARWTDIQ